jgi:hypothetical protein
MSVDVSQDATQVHFATEPTAEIAADAGDPASGTAARRPYNRGLVFTAIGACYAVLAVGTAAAVVAAASPAPINYAALAAPRGATTASASASASASSRASASAAASPSPTPSPRSTVVGSVHDGIHSGDLRFFLLPPPDGPSSVQGDPDGTKESLGTVSSEYGSGAESILQGLRFKAGATITFQDSAIGANVTIELLQFGSSGDASQWRSGFELTSGGFTSFSVPGEPGASAWSSKSDDNYTYIGTYDEGDTFFEVSIYGTQSVSHSAMGDLIKQQHARLADG